MMPFLQRARAAFNLLTKSGSPQTIRQLEDLLRGATQDDGIGTDFKSILTDAYDINPYVAAAVDMNADSVSSIPVLVYNDVGKEIEDPRNPLMRLVHAPNDDQDWIELVKELVTHRELGGTGFLQAVRPTLGDERARIGELYAREPGSIEIIKGNRLRPIAGYRRLVNGAQEEIAAADMLRWRYMDPTDYWEGRPPAKPLSLSIATNNMARRYTTRTLKRGGLPQGILTTDAKLGPGESDSLEERFQKKYGGFLKSDKTPLMGLLKFQKTGLSPRELLLDNISKFSALEIAVGWRIPPELLGDKDHAIYANVQEARYFYYIGRVLPMLRGLLGRMNRWLAPAFPGYALGFDPDKIEALQFARRQTWDQVTAAWFLSVNEKLEALGYGTIENGDVRLVPGNMTPLDALLGGGKL